MTPNANTVFALTLLAAVTALALWLSRRHQRTMYRRNMAQRMVSALASPEPDGPEAQPDDEAEPPVTIRAAS